MQFFREPFDSLRALLNRRFNFHFASQLYELQHCALQLNCSPRSSSLSTNTRRKSKSSSHHRSRHRYRRCERFIASSICRMLVSPEAKMMSVCSIIDEFLNATRSIFLPSLQGSWKRPTKDTRHENRSMFFRKLSSIAPRINKSFVNIDVKRK